MSAMQKIGFIYFVECIYPIEAASAAPRKSSSDNNQNNVQNKYELKTNIVTNNKFGTQTSDAPRGGFSTGITDPQMDGRTDSGAL